jgi:demethylmenaquinone methyltransferase / 2-methoxy-6-polyprenyl-1,4-benzoquinol methylase
MTHSREPGPEDAYADFGFESVPRDEKKHRVRAVFDSVSDRYDLMNDLMSVGLHRAWKRFALMHTGLRPGGKALDLAAGSGDLSLGLVEQVGRGGYVLSTDINERMLGRGRDRLLDAGHAGNVQFVLADAEQLPMRSRQFDCVTIGFGLRNVTDKAAALSSMYRVLKPGGRALILEFSKLTLESLEPLYDFYSFQVLPRLGRLVLDDSASYRYLAESIRRHPDQDTLKALMEAQGFERCRYHNLSGGVVALHVGYCL